DGFEQRRLGLQHRILERFAGSQLEGEFRGVYVVIRAVVNRDLEIDHGKAGQVAVGGGFDDAFLDRGDVVLRDRAAENLVGELEIRPARQWLHADPAIAELPVAAGLFLVPALYVGFAPNGFAIRNLGGLQHDLDGVAFLQTADDDFDMLLALAR